MGFIRYSEYVEALSRRDQGNYRGFDKCHSDDREHVVATFGWCVISRNILLAIRDKLQSLGISKVLSVNCGRGNIESALADIGIDVVLTDIVKQTAATIVLDSESAAREYCRDCKCICSIWPPYEDRVLYDALIAASAENQSFEYVLYIGEDEGGCTGGASIFKLLASSYEEIARFEVFRWSCLQDSAILFRLSGKVCPVDEGP